MIEIIEPGQQTTIQDLGRHGWSQYGVSPSGAADSGSSRLANRLVGNAESAATLEILMGGLVARFEDAVTFALAGARCPATLDGRPVDLNSATTAQAGQVLRLGTPSYRLRTYLGVREASMLRSPWARGRRICVAHSVRSHWSRVSVSA